MNIGQILEVHLGLVGKNLGEQIANIFEQEKDKWVGALRSKMLEIAENSGMKSAKGFLEKLDDESLLNFARDWSNGVKFATPVFEGVNAQEFEKLFALAKIDTDGKTELYDGRTGEK